MKKFIPKINLKTIIHVVGNRPQFIKLAVLYNEISKEKSMQQLIVHTGQHFSYGMSEIFFKELHIPQPTINFNIQNSSANLFIGQAAETLRSYFLQQKNSVVFVYGDTNTTLAAAMAANQNAMPLIHFEAGVRTYENNMPEETNRIFTDRLAQVNYCCTEHNIQTMQHEGYGKVIPGAILLTGDLMLDAFLKIAPSAKKIIDNREYVVCTIHRDANLSNQNNLANITAALNSIHKNINVVMPLHPHTKKKMEAYGLTPNFKLLPPLGYRDMKNLLTNAAYIITDSGGTAREAFFLKKKSLIVMDNPFWPEIIAQKCSINSLPKEEMLIEKFNQLPALQSNFTENIFGDGNAAKNIHQHLSSYLATL